MKARARWPSEAKVLRGYWQGFFRGQAMAHNVIGLCVRFLPTRMFKVSTNVKGKK